MATLRQRRAEFARRLRAEGHYAKAVSLYNRMVADDPTDTEALSALGELCAELEQFPKAASALERAGEQHYREGRATDALAAYMRLRTLVRSRAPELAELYAHVGPRLGDIFEELGLVEDALKTREEEIRRHEGEEGEIVGLLKDVARLHLDTGTRGGAIAALSHLRRAFKCEPCNSATASLLVRAFDHLGERDKGTAVLKQAALIARDAGRAPLFRALCDALGVRAPADPEVTRLWSEAHAGQPAGGPIRDESITDVDIPVEESVTDEHPAADDPDTVETDRAALGVAEDDLPTLDTSVSELFDHDG